MDLKLRKLSDDFLTRHKKKKPTRFLHGMRGSQPPVKMICNSEMLTEYFLLQTAPLWITVNGRKVKTAAILDDALK